MWCSRQEQTVGGLADRLASKLPASFLSDTPTHAPQPTSEAIAQARLAINSMGGACAKVEPHVEPVEDGPVVRLIKVDDLLNNAVLRNSHLGLTSEDILQQHWTAKKSIDGLFGPHSFKLVPWRQLESTEYGVLTYSWGNREKRIWGATWAGMIKALKSKEQLKVKYVWIGAPRPRAPALRPPTLRPPRSGPPAVAQISSASTRTTPRRWRRSGGRTRSTPGRTSTT